jgi:hypothetical protein
MTPSVQSANYADERKCPFCGRPVRGEARQCPFCREAIPVVGPKRQGDPIEGSRKMRRGFLYMLLAGIIYYFAGGYGGWKLPIEVPPLITQYLSLLLFMGGLGMALYGFYLKVRS